MENCKIINGLPNCAFDPISYMLRPHNRERLLFCCAIAVNNFHFFLGGGVDKSSLRLIFSQQKCKFLLKNTRLIKAKQGIV
jgi:hypothetical protein